MAGIEGKKVIWFDAVRRTDVGLVGGKNASLGEMVQELGAAGIKVPDGFATTSSAYWDFIAANDLSERIKEALDGLEAGKNTLAQTGAAIREMILKGDWPSDTERAILSAYEELTRRVGDPQLPVAVRSSATAEDLPDASFAGQQETFLNVVGKVEVLKAAKSCFASLFTDRAISYRQAKGFDHMQIALSVGVQHMVRADRGGSGVMFSIDTETGFDKVVIINAAWGLGENVVQGAVNPDEYQVFKPLLKNKQKIPIIARQKGAKLIKMVLETRKAARPVRNVPTSKAERERFVLTDAEILELARAATTIENHYGMPMDMEWARDGEDGDIYIVQARPETVQAQKGSSAFLTYGLSEKGLPVTSGLAIGEAAVAGRVCLIEEVDDIEQFEDGTILVTSNTDPDWVPIMKRAAAIVTDHGGRTSHAAIVSRELGVPAIVGTSNATRLLHTGQEVTVSCAEGEVGVVYEGLAKITEHTLDPADLPQTETKILLNLANPAAAFRWWRLPHDGVGLARMEFVITNAIRVHPMALIQFDQLNDGEAKNEIANLTRGYTKKTEYFVDRLATGLGRLAAAVHPNPLILRMSDFKSNEYAGLLGGKQFEPDEENPMIGFRGASRYYSRQYRDGFALECQALRRLREEMGFDNVIAMIPFCRSPEEADKVLAIMAENGLKRGENGFEVYVMCEIPSNVVLAREFARRFDGFSIGSNDLTQLTLGVDRDSELLAHLFNEQSPAVKWMISHMIDEAHKAGAKVGLCGQAPSDHPEFAQFLVGCGIDSISVTPDSFFAVKQNVADAERGEGSARRPL